MTNPLRFSMVISADASSATRSIEGVRADVAGLGAEARTAAGGLGTMSAELERSAQAAGRAKAALAGGDQAARQAFLEIGRAQNFAAQSQARFSAPSGLGRAGAGSARDSAGAFAELIAAEKATEDLARKAALLKAALDPLSVAQGVLNAELAEYQQLAARGMISTDELARATDSANERFTTAAARAGTLGTQVKLTGGQVQNLGYQLNDVTTMLLMGASPFSIIASQGGQVVQLLGDGPGGVRGSLGAIGASIAGFVRGLGPGGIALGGLAAAAGAFALVVRDDVEPIEDVIDRQAESLKRLREAYGLTGDAANDYAQRARQALGFAARQDYDSGLGRARGDVAALGEEIFGGRENRRREDLQSFEPLRQAYSELQRTAREGIPDFLAFRNVLTEIAETHPEGSWYQDTIGDVVREILAGIDPSVDFQVSLEGIRDTLDEARTGAKAAASELKALRGEMEGLAYQETEAGRIDRLYRERVDAIGRMQASPRAVEGMLQSADRDRSAALGVLARPALERRQAAEDALANLGLSDIERRLAETAQAFDRQIAAYRDSTNDYAGSLALLEEKELALEAIRRAAAIEETARAEAFRAASAERILGLDDQRASLEAEIGLLGQSEGAAASARFAMSALGEAKRAAASAGLPVDQEEVEAIQAAAAQIGALTDRLAAMREAAASAQRVGGFARGLDLDIRLAGLPQLEQDIARTLDGLKLSEGSSDGQQISAGMRYLEQLDLYQERIEDFRDLNRDIWGGIADDILGGASALEAVDNALKRLASDLLARSMDRVSDGIFGAISPMLGGRPERPAGLDLASIAGRGATPTSPMFVSMVGGLGGGAGGAGGAVERFLNPANGNVPGSAAAGGNSSLVAGIRATAASLGISPQDLATVISYETGGTFDPTKRGPTTQWGQHRGLIQFGEPQARRYGVDWADPVGSQLGADGAIARYMRDAGVRPGHGLLDVYSAVNAGSVGRYDASDAMNGGAPGTVRDKVERQMAGHMQNAEQLLGASVQTAEAAVGGVDQALNGTLVKGLGAVADQFLPGFGGVLENLLKGMQGGGAAGGGLGGLFGGPAISAGAQSYIAANPGGGLWSGGGYTGDGGRFEPAGLVHRGEIVFSQDDVRRAGGVQVVEAMRLGLTGFAGGGVVGGGRTSAVGAGTNVIVNDQRTSAEAEPIETRRSDDGRKVEIFVRDLARDEMTRPGRQGNRVLRQGYGMAAPRISR